MNHIEKRIEELGATFTPAVVGFHVKDNNVLLGIRKKVSMGLGENLIAGIGGKVGDEEAFKDETPEEAMVREVEEEIGMLVKKCTYMGRVRHINVPEKAHWNMDIQVYILDEVEGEAQETEVMKPVWYPREALPTERMWKDNAHWLPQILMRKKIDALFVYDDNSNIQEKIIEESI